MKSVLGTGAKISGANLFALRSRKTPEGFMYMIVPRHTQALYGNAPVHSVEQMIRSEMWQFGQNSLEKLQYRDDMGKYAPDKDKPHIRDGRQCQRKCVQGLHG